MKHFICLVCLFPFLPALSQERHLTILEYCWDQQLFGIELESPIDIPGIYFIRLVYEDGSSRTQKWVLEP